MEIYNYLAGSPPTFCKVKDLECGDVFSPIIGSNIFYMVTDSISKDDNRIDCIKLINGKILKFPYELEVIRCNITLIAKQWYGKDL